MQKLSRKVKYEKLRQELQNDAETQISTKGLSAYAQRLNRLDETATEQLEVNEEQQHDPVHLRREAYFEQEPEKQPEQTESKPSETTFNNEYLDEYISEVKEYNKERGLLASDNTQVNILKQLRENSNVRPFEEKMVSTQEEDVLDGMDIPSFVRPDDETLRNTISMEVQQLLYGEKKQESEPEEEQPAVPAVTEEPVTEQDAEDDEDWDDEEEEQPKKRWKLFGRHKDDEEDWEDEDEDEDEDDEDEEESAGLFSKFHSHMKEEKEIREKLMNETVQMRAQMDEYEEDLNDVNDSVSYTNRMLNFILVLLILALLLVLGIVIYWILLQKGII